MSDRADAYINREKSVMYDSLVGDSNSIFYKHTRTDVYVAAAAMGYYHKKSEKIPASLKQGLFVSTTLGKDSTNNLWIMKSIAIAIKGIEVLSSMKDVISICDEFANSGIDDLYNFHMNSTDEINDMASTLMDILLDFAIIEGQ
ncbi:MAG: hypothetical protein M0Q19_08295 [Candidatus Cloacimonetes bacterium]|nr:hypothetical protein [Candidatus Cloacimonadota bacterium]MCK9333163.1 hypothetical protein [Candidatus Cloacimonadota bacterium]